MLTISATAAKKVKVMMESDATAAKAAGLRIGVRGGGCSGLSYFMEFAETVNPADKVFERDGVKLFVDPKSYLYLIGTEVDYEEGLMGAGFKFKNPNVKSTCGCGESFHT